ncbi:RsmB/NOP family class I SAM-dependent RNA methyltransferase [Cohnella rhizosphaerae]|uniref:RsmB/NOP family class I SAM-dependent RNA methyltransferase n=1 Tax=Cohnella rhizosphaerae TaxID=1457232 RepID=A0A9X4KZA5_9BACL|nr:RsmB/NOP family class I SAM-dependent RNA methyltransferase [Cohnella rhizosphaerae]MDG0813620.1 RsmB/NOP family class I SAM-dependent RNA methyltransferase [Cohnella rhizosphaerae]
MALPKEYVTMMRELLGEEAEAFLASYGEPKRTALRLNALKDEPGEADGAEKKGGDEENDGPQAGRSFVRGRDPVAWAEGAYYTDETERPGKHPYYYAGLYYIQEPSAMLPAELLDPQPGQRVLDLCAAPGGKSTQLAAKLRGTGLLVTNDLATERTKALAKNIERAGVRGAVVTNESPAKLASAFGATFDRVLVDAPCSGEGMFRKDEDMVRQWDAESPARYAAMQDDIMKEAAKLVAPGGRLVYSTCTFSPVENEGTIARFLAAHPEFGIVATRWPAEWGFAPGRPEWLTPEEVSALGQARAATLAGTIRLWPHRVRGEGHFAALLQRAGAEGAESETANGPASARASAGAEAPERPKANENAAGGGSLKSAKRGKRNRTDRGGAEAAGRGSPAGGRERTGGDADALERYDAFVRESLHGWEPPGKIRIKGDYVYAVSELAGNMQGLRLVREGLLLGRATKHRFEPSQALAMGLKFGQAALCLRLRGDDERAIRYLKGETLQPDPQMITGPDGEPSRMRGWTLVCLDGCPLGWGRWDGATLKNELLPGWRQV